MNARSLIAATCVLALTLAACNKTDTSYQGWIEANLIFVAPDEVGRVQALSVREGDTVRPASRCSRSTTICSKPTSPRSKPR